MILKSIFVLESAAKHDSRKAVYRNTYFAITVSGGGLSDTLHMYVEKCVLLWIIN